VPGGEVVVAAGVVGTERAEVVGAPDRDDGLAGVYARVKLSGAQLAQQSGRVGGPLELAEEDDVDRVRGELGDRARSVVGEVDVVAVGVELLAEVPAAGPVGRGDEQAAAGHGRAPLRAW
jgi:hypothetical protein